MPTGWFKGPVCGTDNCPSRRYRSSDGLTICQYGHVMEGNIEIDDDQDTVAIPTRRLNAVTVDARGGFTSGMPSQASAGKRNRRLYGKEGRRLYYRCLQVLLKREFEIILDTYFTESANPDMLLLLKANWMRIIAPYVERSDDDNDEADAKDNHDDEADHPDDADKPAASRRHTQVATLDVLALIYITALQLRLHPLYANQMLEGIRTNEIPYIRCLHLIPKSMLDRLQMSYHRILQPTTLPVKGEFYDYVQLNLRRLGLAANFSVPTNFYYPYMLTVVAEGLMLPNALRIFGLLVDLNQFVGRGRTMVVHYAGASRAFPELQLAALVLFVVRAHFFHQVAGEPVDAASWLATLQDYQENHSPSFLISDNRELIDWSPAKIDRYCDWLYQHLIPDRKKNLAEAMPGDELPIMEKRLYQLFEMDEKPPSTDSPRLGDLLQKMVAGGAKSGGGSTPTPAEVDAKIRARLCEELGITQAQLGRCYDDTTSAIKKALDA
ncbi:uncharacterized protein CANTADRAFT_6757 [Suhomyces tanzawaensis NRRL Y-17324]|uniref:Uncharacterized protein n=1 Tax=Suhomyces tanzawaensis NRRL Y-17324 TaxID=984487 RepID=A0A1E4SFX6_9ASCO|nr:uncharacterized protein CANTADRAFT_6757 [Suhomyces tanzawaensis NRRL Y-17324]ODV78365.1 hypothetical protein CANTADRAFT_6757 [Suhomyces tanzawaensis NRRL Y-17324]